MAILRNDTVVKSADGQHSSAIITAANIGSHSIAPNSTYYIGTTQNVFNRASGAQTLTGVSIDGNAANITAYTINQNVGTSNTPSFAGIASTAMLTSSTSLSNNYDWQNSPITIRERGLVSNGQSSDIYSPNINFHWAMRWSSSLWMNQNGNLNWGGYSDTGVPGNDGVFRTGSIYANIYYDKNNTVYYLDAANSGTSLLVAGNVGIGTTSPAYKLDVGASGNDTISVRLTPGFERVRYYGFDLLGYNDGNLWMIGNNATNTLVLGGSWDWDRQIAIAYTPATTGSAGGSLEIGQMTKNNANFTHGNTRFYTNGLERVRINSSGNIGIGTTSPATLLHVDTAGADARIRVSAGTNTVQGGMIANTNGLVYSGSITNHGFSLRTNDTDRVRIDTSGNVGIGSTSPSQKLHVVGTGFASTDFRAPIFYDSDNTTYYGDFASTSKQYQAILFGDSSRYSAVSATINGTGAGDKLILYGNASNYDARVLVGDDYDFIFKSQGSPSSKGMFRFYSGNSATLALEISATQNTTSTGDFRAPIFYDSNNTSYYLDASNTGTSLNTAGAVVAGTYVYSTTYLQAGNNNIYPNGFANTLILNVGNSAGNNWIAGVSIAQGGNVGIGTISPSAKLHIYNGSSHFETTSTGAAVISSGLYALQIGPLHDRLATAGSYYGGIAFNHLLNYGGGTTYNVAPQAWIGTRLQDTAGSERDYLVFATKPGTGVTGTGNDIPIERMCIDRDGLVGIGTTSPSWLLTVYAASAPQFTLSNATRNFILTNNAGDGLLSFNYASVNRLQFDTTNQWFNTGNVGIGTTDFSYTINDNSRVVGSNTNNRLFVSGSIQLLGNNDAIVFGRGTSTFLTDEELGFGWGGGWYMTDGTYLRVRNDKILYSAGEIWGSIFKDSNNTAFYVDPASTSNLNALTVAGGNATIYRDLIVNGGASGNFGNRIIVQGTATTYTLQDTNVRPTVYLTGAYPVVTLNHTVTGNTNHGPTIQFAFNGLTTGGSTSRQILIGTSGDGNCLDFGFSGGGYGSNSDYNPHNGIAGYSGVTPMRLFSNGLLLGSTGVYPNNIKSTSFALDVRGTGSSNTDFRAPIFYDSNDTTYYIDPASTSRVVALWIRGSSETSGNIYVGGTAAGDRLNINYDQVWTPNGNLHLQYSGGGNIDMNFGGGFTFSRTSLRAPIFYDYNNTAYYVDAASTSVLNRLTIDGGNYAFDYFQSLSDFTSGTLVTTDIPATAAEGESFVMNVVGKSYSASNSPFNFTLQGYLYNSTIINFSGIKLDSTGLTSVKIFENGGVLCFWWPTISYWNAFEVSVRAYNSAKNNYNRVTNITNSTEPTGTKKVTVTLQSFLRADVSATNSVDLRAPIFYDSNDTTYYTDPSSLSNILELKTNKNWYDSSASAWGGGINMSGNNPSIGFQSTASTWWYMLHHSSSAINFYRRSTSGSWNHDGIWDSSGNFIWQGSSVRAPIFYDQNNTALYCDPNGTSNFTGLTVANTITGSVSGNAGTATILQTARNINGTSFNGSAAITTATWGTARTITIGSTGKSVDGSANVSWSLAELGAAATNQTMFIGTTSVAINRASASQTLTGISIDGSSASCTGNSATTTLATKATRANGNFYIDDNYGNTVVGLYSANRYQGVFAMGDAYKLAADGTGVGSLYGIAWSHPNAGGVAANLNDHGALILLNGTYAAAISSSIRCTVDMRTPIYYDSNDTAYYTNLAGRRDTNINGFTARTKMTLGLTAKYQEDRADHTQDTNYWVGAMGYGTVDMNTLFDYGCGFIDSWSNPGNQPSGTSHWTGIQSMHYTNGSARYGWQMVGGPIQNLRFRNTWSTFTSWKTIPVLDVNDGNSGAMYAGIYYDSNNTAYYTDPASTSALYNLTLIGAKNTYLYINPGNGYEAMVRYNGGSGSGWYVGKRLTSQVVGTESFHFYSEAAGATVAGIDTSGNIINNGSLTSTEVYARNWFRNNDSGEGIYNQTTAQHFYSDDVSYWNVASSSGVQGIRFRTGGHNGTIRGYVYANDSNDVGLLNNGGNWRIRVVGGDYVLFDGSSVRAQIFYDSNDTNYYCNPASNSVLNGLYANSYNNLVNDFKDVYVYGDVNTYYIVLIQGEYIYSFGRYSVTRGYNWTGPDTWNVASHKGGLTLDWEWSGDTAWGGNDKSIRIIEFNETYSTMVGGLGYPVNGGVIIWLRGGGVNGAQYRIRTPIGSNSTVTIYDGVTAANHSSSTTFTAADSTVFSTRANTNNVSSEILARYPVRGAATLNNEGNGVLDQGSTSQSKSGILSSSASLRAPIFYDTDNTAYYVDPNSTSNLVGLTVANTITGSVSGNSGTVGGLSVHSGRNNEVNKIVRTDSNGYIQAGWINTTSGNEGTTAIDRVYASYDGYIRYYTPANFRTVLDVPTRAGSGANGSWAISVTGSSASCTGNAATVTNGVYTNTGNTLTGTNLFQSNLGTTSGSLSGPPLQAYATGTNAAFMSFHRGGSYAVNMGLDSDNVLRIGGWSAAANRWELDMSGNNWVASSFRAPIFYDSNNTTYYVDPASTSNLVGLTVANTITGSITGNAGGSSASCSGNAATATVLQTARTIGGVSFNGSANINLPGVNTAGNQNTTGTSSNITAYTINQNVGTANTPKFLNVYGERVAVTSASSTTVNTQYNVTELTMSASITTLTLSNIQASTIVHMWTIVTVGNGTTYSITWPAAIKWPGGTAPTITATNAKRDIYQFVTYDGGTNIYAIIVGQNL